MHFPRLGRMPRTLAPQLLANSRASVRSGFTLVELLVVITIIGILASLITVAAANALWNARQTQIKVELDNLDLAMKNLKAETGAYPPCNLTFDPNSTNPGDANFNLPLKQYIATRFPRYQQMSGGNYTKLRDDLAKAGVNTAIGNVDPARALVFWLGAFNADVTQPFLIEAFSDTNGNGIWDQGESYTESNGNGVYDGASTTRAFFEFDRTRLIQRAPAGYSGPPTKYVVYCPPKGKDVPYVYFDTASYGALNGSGPSYYQDPTGGTVAPYALDMNNNRQLDVPGDTFANPDSFQIISAGQDGQFGPSTATSPVPVHLYPAGLNYDASGADNDNVVNFSDKNNLDAARP